MTTVIYTKMNKEELRKSRMASPRADGSPTAVQLLGNEIPTLRTHGYTLQAIGDKAACSRERIRQIINKYYGGVKPETLCQEQVAELLNINTMRLLRLRRKGLINPERYGHALIYSNELIEKIKLLLNEKHFCLKCGKELSKLERKWCSICRNKSRYLF